jgi:outer membrane protein TolC
MNRSETGTLVRRIVLTVSALILILCTVAAAQRELTLDDAVALGLQNDEEYLIATEELERASGQIREAWAGALPRVDFTGRYTRNLEIQENFIEFEDSDTAQTVKTRFGRDHNYSLGLTLTQPLYLGGKVGGALKIAKYYSGFAKQRLAQAEHDLVYEIKEAFFGAKLAGDVVAVYEDAVDAAELNFENVKKLLDQGMASEFDLLRAEVELANLRPDLIEAKNNSEIAEINLKNRLGIPAEQDVILAYEFSTDDLIEELDLESGLAHALKEHPAIAQQEYAVKSYDKAIGITKADRMPQLVLQSSFDYISQTNTLSPQSDSWTKSWSASLVLSFPIFEGRAVSGRVLQAKADYNQARFTARQVEENVLLAVRSAHASWEKAVESLRSQERTIAQAEEGLRIANLRYENGVGTQLEVLNAQTANTRARVNYINAVYSYDLAVAGFLRAAGYGTTMSGAKDD